MEQSSNIKMLRQIKFNCIFFLLFFFLFPNHYQNVAANINLIFLYCEFFNHKFFLPPLLIFYLDLLFIYWHKEAAECHPFAFLINVFIVIAISAIINQNRLYWLIYVYPSVAIFVVFLCFFLNNFRFSFLQSWESWIFWISHFLYSFTLFNICVCFMVLDVGGEFCNRDSTYSNNITWFGT